ncbi:phosphoribosyltransferase [Noviherbaspirillum cavernae]|uniref:Phosphoribosyltransferase n=2 Tax=Noviherbaspirillum cavernae TaxID=2320862 RepID=A0A418X687_9BURK|nr:phosphoribosyltransferase [Noviherbaspirillum cavernae]
MIEKRFKNRIHAGKLLAKELSAYGQRSDVLVLALPRGGVPVAFAIANSLDAPLDVMLVRKLGVPGNEELAMGAIACGGKPVMTSDVVQMYGITADVIDAAAARELREIERRERVYRPDAAPPELRGRVVILVDDGVATGATMLAAVQAARSDAPAHLVVAIPVGAAETCDMLRREADELVCLSTPHPFFAVGQWYADFTQTSDEEVVKLLREARQHERELRKHGRSDSGSGNGSVSAEGQADASQQRSKA